ncbi:hypothetical protein C1H46_041927 [Malus baccata]|uniref:BED-type domain-containing protein n=1 Tax=Malus baccata TaxID=106549 RepID=A0A540KEG6_MALBA|nr:hypothetical protein C1H46_041927 [Malus baccata]
MDHYCNPFSTDELQTMSRYEESSKHSGIGYSSTGDSPEKPEDEAIEIDSENEIDVEGGSQNDDEESEGEDEKVSNSDSRKRSWVWDHFTTYYVTKKQSKINEKGEKYLAEVKLRRAKCNYCPKQSSVGDYAAEPRVNGTTSMRHHIERYCKFYQGNRSKKQKVLVGDKSKGNNLVVVGFSQESVLEACVKMVVIDEMPFSTVDKMGFRLFCAVGIPLFKVPSRRTLVRTFLNMSHESKAYLKKTLSAHRICLTTDIWTSTQNTNYMVLTSHFIDHEWNMHKRIINFCVIPNHYGTTIAKLIESCLLKL